MAYEVGSKVVLNPAVTEFKWGKGKANFGQVGTIRSRHKMDSGKIFVYVNFPHVTYWKGLATELLVLEAPELPDDDEMMHEGAEEWFTIEEDPETKHLEII